MSSDKPLAIDLYCGLGGWAEGFLAEGYRVVGYDIERHDYGTGGYPGQLVLQDALTLHGSQFKDAAVIVASPPCQEFSYMAMPWSRAKQIARALRYEGAFPEGYAGSQTIAQLTALFDACFRIHREANEAAIDNCPSCGGKGFAALSVDETRRCERCYGCGYVRRYIPLIIENVRGAQRWVGPAKANYGSYYLWGDVGMVGKRVVAGSPIFGVGVAPVRATKPNPHSASQVPGSWFAVSNSNNRGARTKNTGGSWFAIAHNTLSGHSNNPVSVAGRKAAPTETLAPYGGNFGWDQAPLRQGNSKSDSRRAASAAIAKIPFPLAHHIAKCFAGELRYPSRHEDAPSGTDDPRPAL